MSDDTPPSNSLPVLYTTGSFYQVGHSVGLTFKDRIKSFWKESDLVNDILKPIAATPEGKQQAETFMSVCRANFPQYIRELQGIADGSGFAFEDLFLLNMSKEITNVMDKRHWLENTGCTDIFLNTPNCKMLLHNEDCDVLYKSYGYIVNARIVEDGQEVENFTSFCYPGVLPGCSFNFNRHGMIFTLNGIYANFIVPGCPPRVFLNRALNKCRNLEEAISTLENKGFGAAYGFNVNIADVRDPSKMWSVEVGPQANESQLHVHTIHEQKDLGQVERCMHFNHYEFLQVTQIPNIRSSTQRKERAFEFPPPKCKDDAMKILGDTKNELYPIFRSPRSTDLGATVFTAVVDLLKNVVDFYVENPANKGVLPLLRMAIRDNK